MGSLADKLAAALGVRVPPPPCEVQQHFNRYKKYLDQRKFATPLPEQVILLTENFPYLIQLENPNPADSSQWVPAKAAVVVPLLEKSIFDQNGFRFEEARAKALTDIPGLLRNPHCIHRNLRHDHPTDYIRGEFMYVEYYGTKKRKVAFTIKHRRTNQVVLVSSFWSYKKWVADCAGERVYLRPNSSCDCAPPDIEKATSQVASSKPVTLGPEQYLESL